MIASKKMVLWSQKFTTGSPNLDYQHQTLIDNINQLEQLLQVTNPSRQDCEFIIELVDYLEAYADKHFKFEEGCMETYRCPVHAKNKAAHGQFLAFFQQFKEHNKTVGFRHELLLELHATISQWIEGHILQVDTHLRKCIKGRG